MSATVRIDDTAKSAIRAAVPLADLLTERGYEVQPHGPGRQKVLCIFHSESSPSMVLHDTENTFHCYGCKKHGDAFDVVMKLDGLTFPDAARTLAARAGINLNGNGDKPAKKPAAAPATPTAPAPPADLTEQWHRCILSREDRKWLEQERKLSAELCDWLAANGLIGTHQGLVALPVHDPEGRVVGFHKRIPPKAEGERASWIYEPRGTKAAALVIGAPKSADTVLVFESQWDAFAVLDKLPTFTGDTTPAVIVTRGAGNGKLVRGLVKRGAVLLAFKQNDTPADKWLADVAATATADGATVRQVITPAPYKDANDWTRAGVAAAEVEAAMGSAAEVKATKDGLPPWTDAAAFCASEIETPPEIIHGILHKLCKLVIGGSSKARKSWLLLHLALAVSAGRKWLNFETTKARVLFVNLELPTFAIHSRLNAIARNLGIEVLPDTLTLWNLRGFAASYEVLLPMITTAAKACGFGLIILDPSYKLLGDCDENSASDIARLLNALERLTVDTGAAIAFSAHFAKGNASGKEAQDRISGSGVFARDPDAIMVCTALETPDAYAVESILRTLPPQPPFAIRWQYPAFSVADDLDPADLKQSARSTKPTPTAEQVLQLFSGDTSKPRTALLSAVELRSMFDLRGWNRTAAPAVRDRLVAQGSLKVHHGAHNVKLTGLPQVVDAYTKQQAEVDTILEQPALAVRKPTTKRRKR